MSYHSFPPVYRYRPNQSSHGYDIHEASMNSFVAMQPYNDTSRSPFLRPMARFLDETDRPLFTTTSAEHGPFKQASPNNVSYSGQYVPHDGVLDPLPMRYPSPTSSGFSSSRFSSTMSDCELAPFTPPDSTNLIACSPETATAELSLYGADSDVLQGGYGIDHHGSCVALHEVQAYADTQTEKIAYGDDQLAYGYCAQEGYQPMPATDSNGETFASRQSEDCPNDSVVGEDTYEAPPVIRRRRAQSNRSVTSPHLPSKINKRPSVGRRPSSTQDRSSGESSTQTNGNKSFPCPFATYGCGSTFGSKNEWKRHVNTQHMRLGYWRCNQCPHGDRKPNDFNRKDLFIQHLRRMHPVTDLKSAKLSKSKGNKGRLQNGSDDRALTDAAVRCYRQLRTPPEDSGCIFCDVSFRGSDKWDERLEHIGRHMETAKKGGEEPAEPSSWQIDEATEMWLSAQKIIVHHRGRLVLAEGKATT